MLARFLGFREVDFEAKSGAHIKGTSIFLAYKKKDVVGEMARRFFIPEGFILPPVKPSDEINVFFDDDGKPETITIVNK